MKTIRLDKYTQFRPLKICKTHGRSTNVITSNSLGCESRPTPCSIWIGEEGFDKLKEMWVTREIKK